MEHGNLKELIALDVDSSDNLTEEMLFKFIQAHGAQLHGKSVLLMGSSINDATHILRFLTPPPSAMIKWLLNTHLHTWHTYISENLPLLS